MSNGKNTWANVNGKLYPSTYKQICLPIEHEHTSRIMNQCWLNVVPWANINQIFFFMSIFTYSILLTLNMLL